MFDSLFGAEGSLIVRFVVAFVIVLGLIALTFWLIRRFGTSRVNAAAARGRQPRLAVVDAAPIDGRRRLVLVRRDNVEHLIMIGGPSDVVVEQNIVRAVPVTPPRDMPVPRTPGAVEAASSARTPALEDTPYSPSQSDLPSRSLPELTRPLPRDLPPRDLPLRDLPPPRPPRVTDPLARLGMQPPPPRPLAPEPPPPIAPAEPALEPRAPSPAPDAALASMAQRLEAALRRPPLPGEPVKPTAEPPERSESSFQFPSGETPATAPQSTTARPDSAAKSKSVLDSLEEEMANLLGRPPEKQ